VVLLTVTLKVARGLVAADVVSLPARVGPDPAVRAPVRAAIKWVLKVQHAQVGQVALVDVALRGLVRSPVRVRQRHVSLFQEWVQNVGVTPIVNLAKGAREAPVTLVGPVSLLVQADRDVLLSKVLVAQVNLARVPSRDRAQARVVLHPKVMIGSLVVLPLTSLVSVLPRRLVEIVKSYAETAG
jgi:hypothetical protein